MENWIKEISEEKRKNVWEQYKNAKNEDERLSLIEMYHPKGHVNTKPISKLSEFLKCIEINSNEVTWYRGESKEYELLIPKIYRNIKSDDSNLFKTSEINMILKKEFNYFQEFRRRAKSIVTQIEKEDFWSWYFLIQHYGGATRLLDWTSNPMVALFIALDSNRDSNENPIIHLLAPTILSSLAFKNIENCVDETTKILYPGEKETNRWISNILNEKDKIPEAPIALLPANCDPRIISQKSCFTLFGRQVNGLVIDGKEIICPCCNQRILKKLIIDGNSKKSLRQELAKIGISSETIFPGLEGLTKELNEEIFKQKINYI